MSVNYKEKYLKYKIKYLDLSQNILIYSMNSNKKQNLNLSKSKKQLLGAGFNINSPKQYRQHRVNENDNNTIYGEDELNEENDNCVLCLSKLNINPEDEENPEAILPVLSKTFPCHHIFHEYCLKKSLKVNNTCPMCRKDISNVYGLNRETMTWKIQQRPVRPKHIYTPYRIEGYSEDDIKLSSFMEYMEQHTTQEQMQQIQNAHDEMVSAFNTERSERALLSTNEREILYDQLREHLRELRFDWDRFEELQEAVNIQKFYEEIDEQEDWDKYIAYVNEIDNQEMIELIADIGLIAADQKIWRLFKLFALINNNSIITNYINEYESYIRELNQ